MIIASLCLLLISASSSLCMSEPSVIDIGTHETPVEPVDITNDYESSNCDDRVTGQSDDRSDDSSNSESDNCIIS